MAAMVKARLGACFILIMGPTIQIQAKTLHIRIMVKVAVQKSAKLFRQITAHTVIGG